MTSVTRTDIRAACANVDAAVYHRRENQRRYMRGYYADTQAWCKERGICQRCRNEPAEPGRSLCWACRLDNNQRRSGAQQAQRR